MTETFTSESQYRPGDLVVCIKTTENEQGAVIEKGERLTVRATLGTTLSFRGHPDNAWYFEEQFQLIGVPELSLGEVSVDRVDAMITERAGQWGDAAQTHARIGDVWSGILGINVSARQVALCMAGLKLVRAEINPTNEDSYVDGHAYLRFAEDFAE